MNALFTLFFVAIIVMLCVNAAKGLQQWSANNASPVLTVPAQVVSRRKQVDHHTHMDANGVPMSSDSVTYYLTFQLEDGQRLELRVHRREYQDLDEGRRGQLSYQGTRYQGFDCEN